MQVFGYGKPSNKFRADPVKGDLHWGKRAVGHLL